MSERREKIESKALGGKPKYEQWSHSKRHTHTLRGTLVTTRGVEYEYWYESVKHQIKVRGIAKNVLFLKKRTREDVLEREEITAITAAPMAKPAATGKVFERDVIKSLYTIEYGRNVEN